VGAGEIVGQNECSGHACVPIAGLYQQVRKHKIGEYHVRWASHNRACLVYDRTVMVTQSVHIGDICQFEQRTIAQNQGGFVRE
jgi:hypothetical protein